MKKAWQMSTRLKFGIVAALLAFVAFYYFLSDYWIWISGAGVVLLLVALLLPNAKTGDTNTAEIVRTGESGMELTRSAREFRSSHPIISLLLHPLNRIVWKQESERNQLATEAIEAENMRARAERDNYAHRRAFGVEARTPIKPGSRVQLEEDLEDKKAKDNLELQDLRTKVDKKKLKDELRVSKKKLKEPEQTKEPVPSKEQIRQENFKEAERMVAARETEIRLIEINPTLDEETKIQRLNAAKDALAEAQEERLRWL